jgi:hypothetical protein
MIIAANALCQQERPEDDRGRQSGGEGGSYPKYLRSQLWRRGLVTVWPDTFIR